MLVVHVLVGVVSCSNNSAGTAGQKQPAGSIQDLVPVESEGMQCVLSADFGQHACSSATAFFCRAVGHSSESYCVSQ
jgi:hypothetical protein